MINFEWDPAKAELNMEKHGVAFDEACSVFQDPYHREQMDEFHSTQEEVRFISIGKSNLRRILVVANCDRGDNIRIYSARLATAREVKFYEKQE